MISAWGNGESGPASEPPCARRTGWITRPYLRLRTRPCIWTRSSPKPEMKAGRQERKTGQDNIMTQQEEQDMKHGWGSVILSGGQGRRMGGIDKGGLDYKGESFCGIQKQLRPGHPSVTCPGPVGAGSGGREGGLEVIEDTVKGAEGEWIGPHGRYRSCFQRTGLEGLFFVSEICLYSGKRWRPF